MARYYWRVLKGQDYSGHILDIATGLYVAGRAGGYSDYELEQRTMPVKEVRSYLDDAKANARRVKRESRRDLERGRRQHRASPRRDRPECGGC